MPRRPCLTPTCRNIAKPKRSRCDTCESEHQQHRNASRPHYRGAWPRISQAARAHHLATIGPICPGWRREPHHVDPTHLTTDHVTPQSLAGGVRILCRACNSARRDRPITSDTRPRSTNSEHDEQLITVATIDVDGQMIDIKRAA